MNPCSHLSSLETKINSKMACVCVCVFLRTRHFTLHMVDASQPKCHGGSIPETLGSMEKYGEKKIVQK